MNDFRVGLRADLVVDDDVRGLRIGLGLTLSSMLISRASVICCLLRLVLVINNNIYELPLYYYFIYIIFV
jgi:hypothetical protein